MSLDPNAIAIAFRRGQIDAVIRTHLSPSGLYTAEMRHSLALRTLSRAWTQYREDRAITLGTRLVGSECAAERNAFLTLLEQALPSQDEWLSSAIRTVKRVAVAPLAEEARQSAAIIEASTPELGAVLETLTGPKLPGDPLERLLWVISQHRYSLEDQSDALTATARTPCWAINLAAVGRASCFALAYPPFPCPGIVRRRLFRADLDNAKRRSDACEFMLDALHESSCDIDRTVRASQLFQAEFPNLRSNSRLMSVWMLMVGLGELTPAQLARALPATKPGAAKLLRQLEAAHLVRAQGPFEPFVCNPLPASVFPAMMI